MPSLRCPSCNKLALRQVEQGSEDATVYRYMCHYCAHIWTIDRYNPRKVTHVTPLTKKPS